MIHLEGKELHLLSPLALISGFLLFVSNPEGLNTALDLNDLVFLSKFLILLLDDLLLQVILAVLSKQLLSHGKSHSALIQDLVGGVRLLDIVADTEEQETAFRQIQGDLANDLVEALLEKLLTHRAQSSLSCLSLEQLLVKHLTKTCDIDTASWLVAHLLTKVLSLFNPLSWRLDTVQDILRPDRLLIHRWERCFSPACWLKINK